MPKRNIQAIAERLVLLLCLVLLAYLVVRTYVLYRWDWNYIRGPLAPKQYYELGLLDQPIPSEEYYPYTLVPTPIPVPLAPAASASSATRIEKPVDFAKDSTATVENTTEESQ